MLTTENQQANKDVEANPSAAATTAADPAPAQENYVPMDHTANEPQQHDTTEAKVSSVVNMWDWDKLNILVGFFAFVVLVDSAQKDLDTQIKHYQVACGAVSMGIALISFLLAVFSLLENDLARKIISAFQFLWWVAGVVVLTFFGSYQTTLYANGYFGSWFAFFFASLMFLSVFPFFEHQLNKALHSPRKPLWFLIVASAVVMGASIDPCSPQFNCVGYNGWAVSMSSISLIIAIILFLLADKISTAGLKYVAAFLILWWAVGTLVVTFGGPFQATGNGYFFSYAAIVASVSFLQTCK